MGSKRKEIYYTACSDGKHFKTKTPKHMTPPLKQFVLTEEEEKAERKLKAMDAGIRKFSKYLNVVAAALFLPLVAAMALFLLLVVTAFIALPTVLVGYFAGLFFPQWLTALCQIGTALCVLSAMVKWFVNDVWDTIMKL